MQSIIRILKLNEPKKGISAKTGRPYDMQDAECLLLKDTGEIDQVGVLDIPRALRDKVVAGDFIGTFALTPDMASRKIKAVLTGLQPYIVGKTPPPAPAKSGGAQ